MTLTQMECFQAVCKYENFTKAAQAVHISQPALSSTMKKLEEECGLPLFLRHKNQLQITPEGRVLLHEVDLFLAHYEQLGIVAGRAPAGEPAIRLRPHGGGAVSVPVCVSARFSDGKHGRQPLAYPIAGDLGGQNGSRYL